MTNIIESSLKISLIILLFLCLLNMPYGYYQLVRFVAFIVFSILSYKAHKKNRNVEMVIYGGLALFFQPFFKIYLGREMWNMVDVIVGVGLIISLFTIRTKSKM